MITTINEFKLFNESNYIGYAVSGKEKIYITPESATIFDQYEYNTFKAKNEICSVKKYMYRNNPNPYVYISINAKSQNYTSVWIESINDAQMLISDLNECIEFINSLTKV